MRSLLRHPNYYKKVLLFSPPSIRMSGKSVSFGDKEIEKRNFYKNKKILVSKEEPYGKKIDLNI